MPVRVLKRKASCEPYLHRDFHNLLNLSLKYLEDIYGAPAVRAYLVRFSRNYYASLKERLVQDGLSVIKAHYEKIFAAEGCPENLEITSSKTELVLRILSSPAVGQIRKAGEEPAPLYVETLRAVHETWCEGTPYGYELLSFDLRQGASTERFFIRKEPL